MWYSSGGLTWYEFTTVDLLNDITVTSPDITDPMIQLWSDCSTLLTNVCATGTSGSASLIGYQPAGGTGSTILFTVSSASGTQTGDFDICVESYANTDACNVEDTIRITGSTPAADINGNYLPGTTVSFCFDILEFRHTAYNFLHGVVLDTSQLGSAWDLTTLTITSTPSPQGPDENCSLWSFLPSGTVQYGAAGGKYAVGTDMGPGWWFQSSNSAGGPWDCTNIGTLDPNNSWGDGCSDLGNFNIVGGFTNGLCTSNGGIWIGGATGDCLLPVTCETDPVSGFNFQWTFCFDITTKSSYNCSSPETFTMAMETFADGETGSWTDLGCFVDIPEVMYFPAPSPAPIIFSVTTTDVSCFGDSDGIINSAATGGYETINYRLDDGSGFTPFQSTGLFTGLSPGVYTIEAQDDILCTEILSNITISEPSIPSGPPASYNDPICDGNDLNLTAFTGAFSNYSWSGPNSFTSSAQNPSISDVSIGTHDGIYTVTADIGGCPSAPSTVSVTVNPLPNMSVNITDATCNGDADGAATLIASGGTSPYFYTWDANATSQTTATATGLSQGNYIVSVSDILGCNAVSTVTLNEPSLVSATASPSTSVTCNAGSDGQATASGAGGNGGAYTYLWNTTPNQTSATATGLAAGIFYSVTVYDNTGICSDVTTVSVIEPASSVTATISASTSVTCNGSSDGSATAAGSGGNGAPYTFSWNTSPIQNTPTATGLSGGVTYDVTVTDQFGTCNDITSVTIAEPILSVTAAIVSSTSVTCNGGSTGTATASGSGGNGAPYTFAWNTTPTQTGATATGLLANTTYLVTVTDALGSCSDVSSISVSEATPISITFSGTTDASCTTGTNGETTVDVSGGASGYTYQWDIATGSQTAANVTGLIPGTYSVTVLDASLCPSSETITIANAGTTPTASIAVPTQLDCANTSITLDGSGSSGLGALSYNWATTGGNIVSGNTSNNPLVDAPGSYTVTITDGVSGCTDTESITVTQNIITPSTTVTACNGTSVVGGSDGEISIASGNAPGPYTYAWNIAPAAAQGNVSTVTGLPIGTYNATITSSNGCTVTDGCTINDPLCQVTVSIVSENDVSCNGLSDGSSSITMTGGSGTSYSYAWPNGQTDANVTGLSQGSYVGSVTDNNGCFSTATANISQPSTLTAIATLDNDASCFGLSTGSVSGSAVGGNSGYTYQWSSGQTNASVSGLPANNYTVTISDALSCMDIATVTIGEPNALALALSCTPESVSGANDGGSTTTISGGDGNYTFTWSGGETSASLTGLSAGLVELTITDGNGCTITDNCTVSDPGCAIGVSTSLTNVTCNGGSNGTADAFAAGGLAPYTYTWSNGQTGVSATGLSAGNITVTCLGSGGCSNTATISISEPTLIVPNISCTPTSIAGGTDGESSVTPSGGNGVDILICGQMDQH